MWHHVCSSSRLLCKDFPASTTDRRDACMVTPFLLELKYGVGIEGPTYDWSSGSSLAVHANPLAADRT